VLHAGKKIKPLRNRPLQMRSEVLQAVNAENTANYAPLQSINDPEPSCNFPFMEGHVPKPQNYTPLLGNNDHFPTRLLPKLHGYSPKQHEYQFFVIDTDYILNLIRASFTVLYNSVFLKSLPPTALPERAFLFSDGRLMETNHFSISFIPIHQTTQ
jgi:hypothetical protein